MPDDEQGEIADSIAALKRAGWSVGVTAFAGEAGPLAWLVSGSNGENLIRAEGATEAAAWRMALEQARAVGMLARPVGL